MLILRILLGPLLLYQGLSVRKSIIKLPEPKGAHMGTLGDGPLFRLLILGDSAAAGVGVSEQGQALSGQLVNRLATRFKVKWQLVAKTGEKTDSIADLLFKNTEEMSEFDCVVVSLGVNDVTSGKSVQTYTMQTEQLIGCLRNKYKAKHIVLSGVPPMGHFPSLPQPLRWYLGAVSTRFDLALARLAKETNCSYLTLPKTPDPSLMAKDGFHPSEHLYRLWADETAKCITAFYPGHRKE